MVYLDNAATTLPLDISLKAFVDIEKEYYFNTSSSHTAGQKANKILEDARLSVADSLSLDTSYYDVVFTSGASESNKIIMFSILKKPKGKNIITSSAEHKSIESNFKFITSCGYKALELKSNSGFVDQIDLEKNVDKNTHLISIIHTNNITGSINDISMLCKAAKLINPGLIFHSDITQSVGKAKIDFKDFAASGIDAFSFSSHKCYAPKGVGALIIKKGINPSLSPLGGQEKGIRGGTHSLGLIVAFSKSLKYLSDNQAAISKRYEELYLQTINGLKNIKEIKILSSSDRAHCSSIISFSIPKIPGQVSQRLYSEKGIMLGTTSACSSNSNQVDKNALVKLGYSPKDADGALRISFSIYNTHFDIDKFISATKEIVSSYC